MDAVARSASARLVVAIVAVVAGGCRIDAPDLGGFPFACDGETACPDGQHCEAGTCEPDEVPARDAGPIDAGAPDAAVDPSLLVHLPLDGIEAGVSRDAAGDHDAACTTGRCPAPVAGRIGGALEFDGVDDAMVLADPAGVAPVSGTVSAWLYLPAGGTSMTLVGKPVGTALENSFELLVDSAGRAVFYSNASERVAPSAFPVDAWTHLAGTWDGGMFRLYVGGVEADSATSGAAVMYDGGAVLLGMDRNNGSEESAFLAGRLDDVRIYDRALSADEIADLAE